MDIVYNFVAISINCGCIKLSIYLYVTLSSTLSNWTQNGHDKH